MTIRGSMPTLGGRLGEAALWLWQFLRFGFVGIVATILHVAVFSVLLELFDIMAWIANVLAFGLAVCASFFGHFHWTFRPGPDAASLERRRAFPRFLLTAILGLCLNTLVAYIVVDAMNLHYVWAIAIIVLLVPPVIFLIAKFWAFSSVPSKKLLDRRDD